jgi:hypothetical protein
MLALAGTVALGALVLGGMNLFQAVTGRRLSKRPSRRSDAVMRRQSAIAGTALVTMAVLLVALLAPLWAVLAST